MAFMENKKLKVRLPISLSVAIFMAGASLLAVGFGMLVTWIGSAIQNTDLRNYGNSIYHVFIVLNNMQGVFTVVGILAAAYYLVLANQQSEFDKAEHFHKMFIWELAHNKKIVQLNLTTIAESKRKLEVELSDQCYQLLIAGGIPMKEIYQGRLKDELLPLLFNLVGLCNQNSQMILQYRVHHQDKFYFASTMLVIYEMSLGQLNALARTITEIEDLLKSS
jgi:hypothetical protein